MTRLTPESPAGHAPAGLFPFTTPADESPDRPLPREHDANGHYAIGPKLRKPGLVALLKVELPDFAPAREKPPAAEHRREVRAKSREAVSAARLRRSLAGGFARVPHTRRVARSA